MPAEPVLLFAYGNRSRGDDALAPLLLNRLREVGIESVCGHPVRFLEDYQIQVEHLLDLQGCARAILIDAARNQASPVLGYRLQVRRDSLYTTHGMSPETLLDAYQRTLRQAPPTSYMLAIAGDEFELGEGLSERAQDNLQIAFEYCQELFSGPDLEQLDLALNPPDQQTVESAGRASSSSI